MHCGLPMINARNRGLSDITVPGENGFLYDPDDIKGFAEGIRALKNNPDMREQMAKKNQEAVKPFCIEATKREVSSLIHNKKSSC